MQFEEQKMTRLNFDKYTAVYLQTVDSSLWGSGSLISVQISKEEYIRNEFHKLRNSFLAIPQDNGIWFPKLD